MYPIHDSVNVDWVHVYWTKSWTQSTTRDWSRVRDTWLRSHVYPLWLSMLQLTATLSDMQKNRVPDTRLCHFKILVSKHPAFHLHSTSLHKKSTTSHLAFTKKLPLPSHSTFWPCMVLLLHSGNFVEFNVVVGEVHILLNNA